MAWLQNLAGKAENLLVKFDENAANVLNDSNLKHVGARESATLPTMETLETTVFNNDVALVIDSRNSIFNKSNGKSNNSFIEYESSGLHDAVSVISEKSLELDNQDSSIILNGTSIIKRETPSPSNNGLDLSKKEKSECSGVSSKSGSLQNSFIFMDDTLLKYEDKITTLERENDEINQQLTIIKHTYCEVQNENLNLQSQLERTNETLAATQTEMEQYRVRAQRILQEKEKLIRLKQNDSGVENSDLIISNYNDELRKELKFQEEKNKELAEKLLKANNDLAVIQQNFILAQKDNQNATQASQDSLTHEKKIRFAAEEECRLKSKELQSRLQEIAHQNSIIANKSQAIFQLEDRLKQNVNSTVRYDVEERLQNLTHTLMMKQNNLETVTTERNALRLQLEKMENEHRRFISGQTSHLKSANIIDIDEGKSQIPQFLKLSPFDVGVTRKVKHAYSSLDAISIRTGIFLRRYPIVRLFVFCYIVMLHIWVLIILCTYIPSTSH